MPKVHFISKSVCQPGALGSRLDRLTAGCRGGVCGNGDISCMVHLAGGIKLGIIGRFRVVTYSVAWRGSIAIGDGETSGAGAGPAGVVGATSGGNGGNGNIGGIVHAGGRVVASLMRRSRSTGQDGSGEVIGVNFRRKHQLRSVTRPDTSTLTWYWSCCLTSTTVPVWSHLFGCGPGVMGQVLARDY